MKSIVLIALVGIGSSLCCSCVSTKKYNEALASKAKQEEQYNNLQAQYAELQKEKEQLQSSTSDAMKQQQRDLYETESALKERERKIRELKAEMDAQRNALSNLKQEVCSALKCFTPDELKIEVREGKLYVSMFEELLFPSGSDKVNARGREAIEMLAAVLANSKLEVMVEGHTDPVPINTERNRDNWDLSVHRATSVTRILIENGIDPERIIASGRGQHHPIWDNENAEGRQQNRRTEIVLAPKLDKLWKLTEEEEVSSKAMLDKK